jgi:hypothetical protein
MNKTNDTPAKRAFEDFHDSYGHGTLIRYFEKHMRTIIRAIKMLDEVESGRLITLTEQEKAHSKYDEFIRRNEIEYTLKKLKGIADGK